MFSSKQSTRAGAGALGLAGALWVLYPSVRPWRDEATVVGARTAMSSDRWVLAHLFAMFALVLFPLGVLALSHVLAGTSGGRAARAAVLASWVGVGLSLPYYGAEDFALHAIASRAASGAPIDLLGLVDAIRFGPVAATLFATGLVLLATSGVLLGVAIWRSGLRWRWAGVPAAAGLVLLIPQFYLPPWARIAHGALLGAGLALVAWVMLVATTTPSVTAVPAGRPAHHLHPAGTQR
jgi:hypothetical protein